MNFSLVTILTPTQSKTLNMVQRIIPPHNSKHFKTKEPLKEFSFQVRSRKQKVITKAFLEKQSFAIRDGVFLLLVTTMVESGCTREKKEKGWKSEKKPVWREIK